MRKLVNSMAIIGNLTSLVGLLFSISIMIRGLGYASSFQNTEIPSLWVDIGISTMFKTLFISACWLVAYAIYSNQLDREEYEDYKKKIGSFI